MNSTKRFFYIQILSNDIFWKQSTVLSFSRKYTLHKNSSTIYPSLYSACEIRAEYKMNQEFCDMNILESENIVQHLNIYIFSQISRFGCWNVILYLSLWSLSDWCLHSCIYSLYVAVRIWISDFIFLKQFFSFSG